MDALSEEKRKSAGWPEKDPLNVTKIALYAPDGIWRGHVSFTNACIYDTIMDERLREFLILRLAYVLDSEYEIFHHIRISTNLGITDEERENIRSGDFSRFTAKERAVLQFTTEVTKTNDCSDATMNEVLQHFTIPEMMELLLLVIKYAGTATMCSVLHIAVDGQAVEGWNKAKS
jgi:alkylhydroperoxidase family enzyme